MTMHVKRVGMMLLGASLAASSCSAYRGNALEQADAGVSNQSVVDSPVAAMRIDELRARFRMRSLPSDAVLLERAVATQFEVDAAGQVHAVLPSEARRGVTRPARVALPMRANGEVEIEDETSHVSVRFALQHVRDVRIEAAGGIALYRGALDGADVVHRVHAEGTEDFVVFETRPAREELTYSMDVSRVPGLRLVSNTLEFLDDTGTPLLRVAPPYLVDAKGVRYEAKLAVNGCAYDTSPAGPWGRAVTRPGAEGCSVRVAWSDDVTYPAIVDPAWSATGSMAAPRSRHTASVLPSGKVLVAGSRSVLASAELFDPAGNANAGTFAATGSMAVARFDHSASTLLSGKVLVAGGQGNSGDLASAELYDPATGLFTATGSMANAREYHTATVLPSGKVLVAGGCADLGNCVSILSSAEVYDPTGNAGAGAFGPTASMATVRYSHTASLLLSGKVLIAGGSGPVSLATAAEVFNPAGNAGVGTFAGTGPMVAARYQHTAAVLPSGKVLLAGGVGSAAGATAELFDPAGNAGAGTFASTGSMATARNLHKASVLPSGKVLVVGGFGNPVIATAELYDPAGNAGAGTFGGVGPMATGRYFHSISLLASGKVLIAGGWSAPLAFLASAEVFGGALGEACVVNGYCLSGYCADGFCCNTSCGGSCDRCNLAGKEGTCAIAPVGDPGANPVCSLPYACDGLNTACPTSCLSDAACAADSYCAPSGTCEPRKAQAATCDPQTDCKQPNCRECASGFCADGFCCDKACDGTCQACSAALKFSGAADGTCDSAKVGPDPGGTVCTAPKATCDGDHTTTGTDGKKQDCAPYKCLDDGTCRPTCTSVNDCASPAICDSIGHCAPPSADTGSSGGCAVSPTTATTRDTTALPIAFLCTLAALARRRRRRPAP